MKIEITQAPVAETEMLIRRSVADAVEAFIDPDVTTNFWFGRTKFTSPKGCVRCGRSSRRPESCPSPLVPC